MNFCNLARESQDFRLMMNNYIYSRPEIIGILMDYLKAAFNANGIRLEISPCIHFVIDLDKENILSNNPGSELHVSYNISYGVFEEFFKDIRVKKAIRDALNNYSEEQLIFLRPAFERVGEFRQYTSLMFNVTIPNLNSVYVYI